jgi:hypothetical protein
MAWGRGRPSWVRGAAADLALAGVGGVAGAALVVDPQLGAYLVAAGLLGHAAWDVDHYRANRVVVRSMAEFCLVLDTALAAAIVLVTMRP